MLHKEDCTLYSFCHARGGCSYDVPKSTAEECPWFAQAASLESVVKRTLNELLEEDRFDVEVFSYLLGVRGVTMIRHALWIRKTDDVRGTHFVCSECGNRVDFQKSHCCDCGAKML